MARISSVPFHQIAKFHKALSDAGMSDELAKLVVENPEMAVNMVSGLRTHPRLSLVHTMFTRSQDLKDQFMQRCLVNDIDVNKFSWVGNPSPLNYTRDPDVAVVLYGTLGTVQQTAEFACDWMTSGRPFVTRAGDFKFDRGHLAQLSGQTFVPWKLQWMRIKVDANVGRKPGDIRDARFSPGCALLFLAAQHPERIRAVAEQKRCGFWIPGLMSSFSNGVWRCVPRLTYSPEQRRVELNSAWVGDTAASCAVPAILPVEAVENVPVAV